MPMALGHEAAGIVEELGEGVTDLERGDHVVLVFVPSCGHCRPCAEGRPALCEPGAAANGAGTLLVGRTAPEPQRASRSITISAARCSPNTRRCRGARWSRSTPSCRWTRPRFSAARCSPASARWSTRRKYGRARRWRSSASAASVSRRCSARTRRARGRSSPSTSRTPSSSSRSRSAPRTRSMRAIPTARNRYAKRPGGVEYAFEFAGSVRALELAYKITRRGGTTVTAGLPPPTATFALPPVNLVAEERTVKGSYIGTCVPSRDIPRYIELLSAGQLAGQSPDDRQAEARRNQRWLRPPARGQGGAAGDRVLNGDCPAQAVAVTIGAGAFLGRG